MELLLIRHGLPVRRHNPLGPADPPLSEPGRVQARQLAAWLADERIDALYTSPLRRARETAAAVAERLGLEAGVVPGVAEFDRDAPLYVPLEELKAEDYPAWRRLVDAASYQDGDVAAFRRTVVSALDGVIAAHPGERVAVVCHGGVINAFAAHLLGLEALFLFEPVYTSISRFRAARSGERSLASLNETAHLREAQPAARAPRA